MRLPVSSGGNPQRNQVGASPSPNTGRPAPLAPAPLTETRGSLNVKAPGSAFGAGVSQGTNIFGPLADGANEFLRIYLRNKKRDDERARVTRNSQTLVDIQKWKNDRQRVDQARSGQGFRGMTADNEASFDQTFLTEDIKSTMSEEEWEEYYLIAEQEKQKLLSVWLRTEDTALDAAKAQAINGAEASLVSSILDHQGDEIVEADVEAQIFDINLQREIDAHHVSGEEQGPQVVTEEMRERARLATEKTMGATYIQMVQDLVAEEEYAAAEKVLESRPRRYFGDAYDELWAATKAEGIVGFATNMFLKWRSVQEMIENEPTWDDRSDKQKRRAILMVGENERYDASKASGPFTKENNGDLISQAHDRFRDDYRSMTAWLRESKRLNAYQANIIAEGVREILTDDISQLDSNVATREAEGRALLKAMNGELPDYRDSALLASADSGLDDYIAAKQLHLAAQQDDNEHPKIANQQYTWGMSQPLAKLRTMSVSQWRNKTLYATGEDREKLDQRYKAARWSDETLKGKFESQADRAKIALIAHDMVVQEGLDEDDGEEYNRRVAWMRRELLVALEPVSGLPLELDTVASAARDIIARIPDIGTSTSLFGLDPDDDWSDLRKEFKKQPTAEDIRRAEAFFPERLRDQVTEDILYQVVAAQYALSADGLRADVKRDALNEILEILDELEGDNRAEYLDNLGEDFTGAP